MNAAAQEAPTRLGSTTLRQCTAAEREAPPQPRTFLSAVPGRHCNPASSLYAQTIANKATTDCSPSSTYL